MTSSSLERSISDRFAGYGIAAQGISFVLGLFGAAISPLTAAAARRLARRARPQRSAILLDFAVAVSVLLGDLERSVRPPRHGWSSCTPGPATPTRPQQCSGSFSSGTSCATLAPLALRAGCHRRSSPSAVPPFVEAIVNLGLSLWWVHLFRANGVAWATVVGALVGPGSHVILALARAREFTITRTAFTTQAISRPAAAPLPAVVALSTPGLAGLHPLVVTTLVLLGSGFVAWFICPEHG